MSSDDRCWLMQTVLGMDIASTVSFFYPRLIPIVSIYCGLPCNQSVFRKLIHTISKKMFIQLLVCVRKKKQLQNFHGITDFMFVNHGFLQGCSRAFFYFVFCFVIS